ncbi:hypothetical protein CC86DRAFT_302721 [Ophiobolus disseminans]|uniref:MULE transposase domain-containing protein n=1 Tax=Ophiobolus disseminans TaxID=1469910 RepID=A0A6A6ZLN7_9PLEO|nr:hypothetical protein CC86DRAFT_302721 [Ophiobolus disseminans]
MLFLHIVSITSINKTYDIAFCLLANKEEDSYNFSIDCLKKLYKHVKVSP